MRCPECEDFELRQRSLLWWGFNRAMAVMLPRPRPSVFEGTAAIWRAALGAPPEPTWYERHRQRWEETGDVIELERMARHVVEVSTQG